MRIGIVAGVFAHDVVDEMIRLAERTIRAGGHEVADVVRVPGTFDLPLPVDRLLARADVDAAVALGAIITGETKHDEVIAHATARSLQDVSVRRGKPVGLGITGPGMTHSQARARVDAAARAVEAVVALHAAGKQP